MKKLSFVLILALSLSVFQSCQKDEVPDPYAGRQAPELPKEETFIMPFDDFSEFGGTDIEERDVNNWAYSAGTVLVWNTILTLNLAIPTASFYASFGQQPVYQGNGVWLWAYEVTHNGNTLRSELYGQLQGLEEVKWDMYITHSNFGEVHWYTGITANDQSYATWTLNHNPNAPEPFIGINYQRDNGNGVASIRYTNIIPGAPENGSYIEFRAGEGAGEEFDRAYEVFRIDVPNTTEINWDSINKSGRVKDAAHFGDGDWHCWDTNLQDTDC